MTSGPRPITSPQAKARPTLRDRPLRLGVQPSSAAVSMMRCLDAVGREGSQERALAYSVVQDIENKFIFRVNHQEEKNLATKLNMPDSHIQVARRLRKGDFLAYVGRFAYVVDCFSTSTPEEFELFKTDDAMMSDRDVPGTTPDPAPLALDELWPAPIEDATDEWPAAVPAHNEEASTPIATRSRRPTSPTTRRSPLTPW